MTPKSELKFKLTKNVDSPNAVAFIDHKCFGEYLNLLLKKVEKPLQKLRNAFEKTDVLNRNATFIEN